MPVPSYDLYFEQLAKEKPGEVCRRTLCDYDEGRSCYVLTLWGRIYEVFPRESRIHRVGEKDLDSENYNLLFILQYLLNAKAVDLKNQWISEKDIPGGPTFFRGPHQVPTRLISGRFGNDLEGLNSVCRSLGGTPLSLGDAAWRFVIAPRIPVALVYWTGDEDFPAEAKLLFDQTLHQHLALDVIFALAVLVCGRVAKA